MTKSMSPWWNMGLSSQRRAVADSQHDVFWVVDQYGSYGFLIQTKDVAINTENNINLSGITLYKRNVVQDSNEMFLLLVDKDDWEIFQALCHDLIDVCLKYVDQSEMIVAIEKRLKRWQQLLKRKRSIFTPEQQMGLYSELLCLLDVVMEHSQNINDAIWSWVGPESDKQDFLLMDCILEVKSHRTSRGETVHVSSAHQLYSEKEPLYLITYALTNTESGFSVKDISSEIKKRILNSSVDLLEVFEEKLVQYGYVPELINEPLQRFVVDSVKAYRVRMGFPRIIPIDLHSQISSVNYSIDLSNCREFAVDINEIKRRPDL